MDILKEVGKFIAPGAAKVIERYGSKPEDGTRLGLLSKDILRAAFPGVYAITDKFKSKKPKKRDETSAVSESINTLAGEVVETNTILTSSIEIQTQQNIILTEILKALKEGKSANDKPNVDLPDLPSPGGKGKGGKRGAGAGGKGKPPKGKPTVKSRVGNLVRGAGSVATKAPVVGGLISAGIEYSESGNVGRAAAAGGGAVAGSVVGTALGTGAGALLGGVGAVPLGYVGGILGGIVGGELGKYSYDLFGGKQDKKEQKYDIQNVYYNAESLKFKSNTMSIKAREFTIKGDVGGLNLGAGSSEPGILPGVARGDAADRQRAIDEISTKLKRSRPGTGNLQGFNIQPGIDTRVNQEIVDKLKGLQSSIPTMTITSGYRDPARNAAAGGASGSQHLQGNAVDIHFPGGIDETIKAIQAASAAGVGGIGVYGPGKLHLDTGSKRAWGPTYGIDSVPQWAVEAIQKHLGLKGYERGTKNAPKGPAVVGEKGSEIIVDKKGKQSVTPSKATIVNLNQGDQVLPSKPSGVQQFLKSVESDSTMQLGLQNLGLEGQERGPTAANIIETNTQPVYSYPDEKGKIQKMPLSGGYMTEDALATNKKHVVTGLPGGGAMWLGNLAGKILVHSDPNRQHLRGQEGMNTILRHETGHVAAEMFYKYGGLNNNPELMEKVKSTFYDPNSPSGIDPSIYNPETGTGQLRSGSFEESRQRLKDLQTRSNYMTGAEFQEWSAKIAESTNERFPQINKETDTSEWMRAHRSLTNTMSSVNEGIDKFAKQNYPVQPDENSSTKMLEAQFGNAN